MLAEGTTAPAFSLPDQHGNTVSSDDFSGRWLLMWWYVKASTPG